VETAAVLVGVAQRGDVEFSNGMVKPATRVRAVGVERANEGHA
jgi:hypothetical protein